MAGAPLTSPAYDARAGHGPATGEARWWCASAHGWQARRLRTRASRAPRHLRGRLHRGRRRGATPARPADPRGAGAPYRRGPGPGLVRSVRGARLGARRPLLAQLAPDPDLRLRLVRRRGGAPHRLPRVVRPALLLGADAVRAGRDHPGPRPPLPAGAVLRLLDPAPGAAVGSPLSGRGRGGTAMAGVSARRRRDPGGGGARDGAEQDLRQQLRVPQRQAGLALRAGPAGTVAVVRRRGDRSASRVVGPDDLAVEPSGERVCTRPAGHRRT